MTPHRISSAFAAAFEQGAEDDARREEAPEEREGACGFSIWPALASGWTLHGALRSIPIDPLLSSGEGFQISIADVVDAKRLLCTYRAKHW